MKQFNGLIAAVFTPMKGNGDIDVSVIPAYVKNLINNGISGIYVCGTTGEGISLTTKERMEVTEAFIDTCKNKLNIIVQTGHNSLREAMELAAHAQKAGADAVAAIPPSYFKPTSTKNLIDCLALIAKAAADLPFFYYHIPALNSVMIDMLDFLESSKVKIPNLEGIKYSAPTLYEFISCARFENGRYTMLFGVDEMLVSALASGAKGAVGSTYNFAPKLYHSIIKAYNDNDMEEALMLQDMSVKIVRTLLKFDKTALPALKAMMKITGIDCGPVRLPLVTMTDDKIMEMERSLKDQGLLEWII